MPLCGHLLVLTSIIWSIKHVTKPTLSSYTMPYIYDEYQIFRLIFK